MLKDDALLEAFLLEAVGELEDSSSTLAPGDVLSLVFDTVSPVCSKDECSKKRKCEEPSPPSSTNMTTVSSSAHEDEMLALAALAAAEAAEEDLVAIAEPVPRAVPVKAEPTSPIIEPPPMPSISSCESLGLSPRSSRDESRDDSGSLVEAEDEEGPLAPEELASTAEGFVCESSAQKKQRRLIRNRVSAQLHRERKKAYVDQLEQLVRDRDAQLCARAAETCALRAENALLREQLERFVASDGSLPRAVASDSSERLEVASVASTGAAGPSPCAAVDSDSCASETTGLGADSDSDLENSAEPPAVVSSQSSPQRDHEDCAVHPAHKKARTGSTLALLGVLACVALVSPSRATSRRATSDRSLVLVKDAHHETARGPQQHAYAQRDSPPSRLAPQPRRRQLLSVAADEQRPRALASVLGVANSTAWVYERDLEREFFPWALLQENTTRQRTRRERHGRGATDDDASSKPQLRGSTVQSSPSSAALAVRARSAPIDATAGRARNASSYVVCSKATGVVSRGDAIDRPKPKREAKRADRSLDDDREDTFKHVRDHDSSTALVRDYRDAPRDDAYRDAPVLNDLFMQLLVPAADLDVSAWGYSPAQLDDDSAWVEIGCSMSYARLVRNVKFDSL